MPNNETLRIRTGPPGSGKSYSVVREILVWMEEVKVVGDSQPRVYHNLPLNVDAIADWFSENGRVHPGEVRKRLIQIPEDVEAAWRAGELGPAEYFDQEGNLSGCWIILDEAHTFIGRKHEAKHRRRWQEFCGELRHRGCCLEFLTQGLGKMADEVEIDITVWTEVNNREIERFCGMLVSDLYQLRAKLLGEYTSAIKSVEYIQQNRRWVPNDRIRVWALDPQFYKLYNSYANPKNGGESGRRLQPYEMMSGPELLWWFLKRNGPLFMESQLVMGSSAMIGALLLFWIWSKWSSTDQPSASAATSGASGRPVQVVSVPVEVPDLVKLEADVVGMIDDAVMFSDGSSVLLGDSYAGSVLQSIDAVRGVARLSDGRRLSVRSRVVERASERGNTLGPAVRANLPAESRGAAPGIPAAGRIGSSASDVVDGDRPPAEGAGQPVESTLRSIDRRGAGTRSGSGVR